MDRISVLISAAVGIGFIHTLIGVDHTLPFVVLGRARGWSLRKTLWITGLCGGGHVASSILLGGIGIGLAIAATGLDTQLGSSWLSGRIGAFETIESLRGDLAAWALILFGLCYTGWSLVRRRRQRDIHEHGDGLVHSHSHPETGDYEHTDGSAASLTAWSLFVIFVLGPCEPLIPVLMVPAFEAGLWAVLPVTAAFAVTTIGTMLAVVAAAHYGLRLRRFPSLQAHAHTLSGLAIASSGLAIRLFGI
jgi:nickel/cobalt exporter